MIFPILSAILGILAFLPFDYFWPFGFIFLVPLFIFTLKEQKFWRLIAGFFIFRIVLMLATLYFAFDPYIFLLSTLIFIGLPIIVYAIKKLVADNYWLVAILPILWTIFEYLQNQYSFLPMNIMTAGNILGFSPFLGLAAIGGLNLLTFFATSINAIIAFNLATIDGSKMIWGKFKVSIVLSIVLIIILFSGWQISLSQLQKNTLNYNNLPKTIKIGAVSNNDKFNKEFLIFKNNNFNDKEKSLAESMVKNALQPLKSDLEQKKINLLILPEDMIDIEIWNNADEKAFEKFNISNAGILIKNYGDLAKELNSNLVATFTTIRGDKRYNSALLFDRNGELVDVRDKSRLTIASEWWPFGNWRPFYYNWFLKITPELGKEDAFFDKNFQYTAGKRKILQSNDLKFASLICLEIHYPYEVKKIKKMGTDFISHNASSQWVSVGSDKYMFLTNNLRRIEAVWLKTPIVINGGNEKAGVITPDGKIQSVDFENKNKNKNYGNFIGEIKI